MKYFELEDWDTLVKTTYNRPYAFQQQDGGRDRGTAGFTVPNEADESEMFEAVPEILNGEERGVKFAVWLARDPKQPIQGQQYVHELSGDVVHVAVNRLRFRIIELWWERTFYPDLQMLANDLFKRGLLEAGKYRIVID